MTLLGALLGWALVATAAGASVHEVQPNQDLQAALNQAQAGDTVQLAPGVHKGPVTVDKPVTIRGSEATVDGQQNSSVFTVRADNVRLEDFTVRNSGRNRRQDDAGVLVTGDSTTIRNLTIRRSLHGIYLRESAGGTVADNTIVGLADQVSGSPDETSQSSTADQHHAAPGGRSRIGNGIHLWHCSSYTLRNNRVRKTRDGIYVSFTQQTDFRNNEVRKTRYGFHYMYSDNNLLRRNVLRDNVAGAALMYSRNLQIRQNQFRNHRGLRAFGLLLQDVDASTFRANHYSKNRLGISLQKSTSNRFIGETLRGNLSGIHLMTTASHNQFTQNRVGPNLRNIELSGQPPTTEWHRNGQGNRWFGSLTVDLDGDGVSALPHNEVDLLANQRGDNAYYHLFTASPGIRLVEWALSRAPLPDTPHITDPYPLSH